jgi:hypothetical protein
MTEAEWLACADPKAMLVFLRDGTQVSDRKLRLFTVACCRSVWHQLPDECSRQAVQVGEQYADGLTTDEERNVAWDAIRIRKKRTIDKQDFELAADLRDTEGPVYDNMRRQWFTVPIVAGRYKDIFLRDIFGNPFHPSPPLPSAASNDRTIPRLAQAIYEDRKMPEGTLDNGRLAILADALIDGGCDDEGLLAHLRSPGPHVRGCWAVDLILGKS